MPFQRSVRVLGVFLVSIFMLSSSCSTGDKKLSPDDQAKLYLQVAMGYLREKDTTSALRQVFEAESISPDYADVHHLKAMIYMITNEIDSAITSSQIALKLNPKSSASHNLLGNLLMSKREFNEAEEHLKLSAADPLFTDNFKSKTALGIIEYRRGNLSKAELHLQRAIGANPTSACDAYYYLGQVFLIQGKVDSAITQLERGSHKQCSMNPETLLSLGDAYARQKKFDAARKELVFIQANFPDTEYAQRAVDKLKYLP